MKKIAVWMMLGALCLLLCGCMASPPDSLIRSDADPSALISAGTQEMLDQPRAVSLYFRYKDTGYLAPEQRLLSVGPDETLEMALVQALIQGPSATQSAFSPLFPAGTKVLSVTSQGDTLFITFNEALLSRYSDEPKDLTAAGWKTEAPLRRRLCMDSLTATLTEAGLCTRVQVLVYQENNQSISMRLPSSYFLQGDEDHLVSFLTRNEDTLLTPHNAAHLLLNAWMTQDWETLYAMVHGAGRPGETAAIDAFSAAHVLTSFTLSPGDVSLDGRRAILSVHMTLRGEGQDVSWEGYPLRMVREEGIWKMEYDQLFTMMNQD